MTNKAMITVTTADSKYSRMTVLGGPVGSVSTNESRSRPFGLTGRALKTPALSLFPVVIAGSFIDDIVDAGERDGQAMYAQDSHLTPSPFGRGAGGGLGCEDLKLLSLCQGSIR